MIADIQH